VLATVQLEEEINNLQRGSLLQKSVIYTGKKKQLKNFAMQCSTRSFNTYLLLEDCSSVKPGLVFE